MRDIHAYIYTSGVGRCSILGGGGGANFFRYIYMYTYACTCLFFMCKTHCRNFLKLKFVFEPKKLLQKWIKKNIFTVKIPLIAPTLRGGGGGGRAPPDLYSGGRVPPAPPPFLLLCIHTCIHTYVVLYMHSHTHSYQVSLIHSETHFFQYCLTFSLFI